MNFLNPFFLLGLLAAAIPLVIHLINLRRPRKIAFPTLAFFNELKKSAIRRIRIKQYLLMALRVLAILLLALALARPFLPPTLSGSASSAQPKAIALLIDNSASTRRIASGGPLISQAKHIADDIVESAQSRDRFIIGTTNGASAISAFVNGDGARQTIDKIQPVETGNYTAQTFGLLREALQRSGFQASTIYIITDGQKTQFDGLKELPDHSQKGANLSVQIIKLQKSNQQNTAITSVQTKSQILGKGSAAVLQVSVRNMGSTKAVNQFVSLSVEGRMAGQYEVSLNPGERKTYLFEIRPEHAGDISGHVTLEGDEVPFDNTRYFVLRIPRTQSVLLLTDEKGSSADEFASYITPALQAAADNNAQFDLHIQNSHNLDASDWQAYDAVILDGLQQVPEYLFSALQQQVQKGKGVLFFPSAQGDIQNYNRFFGLIGAGSFSNIHGEYASFKPLTRMANPGQDHPILKGLFKKEKNQKPLLIKQPDIFFYYQYKKAPSSAAQTILKTDTGDPLLVEQDFGKGKVLISTMGGDPGWSNFPVNPLFAPLYYRSVRYVASGERGGLQQHVLGEPFAWRGQLPENAVTLTLHQEEMKPDVEALSGAMKIGYNGREWTPGILHIASGDKKYAVAVNQNIMESNFRTLSPKDLDNIFNNSLTSVNMIAAGAYSEAGVRRQLKSANFGKEIWSWFIWAAVLFLITETLVSKTYKAEIIS